jgi:hypothetical protein
MTTMTSERRKTPDDLAQLFSDICDVVERTMQGLPLDHSDGDPLIHSSAASRAAAVRIVKLLAS